MKNKKDISDLIRDNQHKLEEHPSDRTWKRLESKLDNQRSKGHTFLYRQIAMAAAVIALVAVISLITILSNKNSSQFAKADYAASTENWIVQDLETVYTDANANIRLVVEFQKELKEHYANPIEEGAQAKKLVASNKTFTGSVNRPEGLRNQILALKENKERIFADVTDATSMESNELEQTKYFSEESTVSKPEPNAEIFAKKKSSTPTKKLLTTTQQMEWIIGEWKENGSIVKWQKVNNSTLLSDEFILEEKQDNRLYFIDTKTQQSYTLKSEDGDKKVFSNKNSDRFILEKISPNEFTLSFLPSQGVKTRRSFTK